MKLKYVIIDDCLPIVFGEYFQHSRFRSQGKITSAGFCAIKQEETDEGTKFSVTVWGESVSCGVKSQPSDANDIARMFNSY